MRLKSKSPLRQRVVDKQLLDQKLAQADNSSMAQNEDEMKRLGKEMDQMKTNSELVELDLVPDPKQ